jgi:hypothetical protein
MAGKKSMESLLPILENLYLDYLAFRHIAKAAEPQKWAIHLNNYRKAKRPQVAPQFEAIIDDLRNDRPSPEGSCDEAARRVADLLVNGMLT